MYCMSSMRMILMIVVILVLLVFGLWETEAISVTGELGGEVKITCSHTNANTNVKYFCRGACTDADVLITSREMSKQSQKKYSITDKGNTFYVTIFHLTVEDSGTYWCGIERVGLDTYNIVVLTVIKGDGQDPDNFPQSEMLVYIGTGLGVAVLALAIVLLIFLRHRKRAISASSGLKDGVKVKSDSRTNSTFSSLATQHQDTRGDHVDTVCSDVNVSLEAQSQSDGLFYAAVSFNKNTDHRSAPPHSAVTYATIGHTSSDESRVYSL